MATREEKLQIVEQLKAEIDAVKTEIEEKSEIKKRSSSSGSLMRTGIVLLIIAAGICLVGLYLL